MPTELVTVNLTRESEKEEWGFELAGGGRDKNVRLYIEQVKPGSIAEKVGLKVKDSLVKIGHDCALDYTIEEAHESLKRGKDFFDMIVEREAPDVVLQRDVVEDPRYNGLKKEDRTKVGFHVRFFFVWSWMFADGLFNQDVAKPTLRKDWNCPWIRRDGKGIKKVVRYTDPTPAPTRTSLQHFYSEPGSILAPEPAPMAPEQLEKLIQEKMGLLQQEEDAMKKAKAPEMPPQMQEPQIQEERFEQNRMEVEFSHQQQQQQQQMMHHQEVVDGNHQRAASSNFASENGELDEEDSCPPDLEAVEVVQQQQVKQQETEVKTEVKFDADSELLRNLAIAIKAGMESYQGMETYEPSADELIDVLKNLENLAAQNPALYRAIVDQIKGNQQQSYEETNGHQDIDCQEEQGYSEVDQQQEQEQQYEEVQEEQQYNGDVEQSEPDHVAVPNKSPEEIRQEDKEARIQKEVDREHEEQMRLLREKKKKEKEPPPPPKTITVMAGSRNRPSWPIAPGIANSNAPRQITLVSGEDEEELMRNRIEVAQAAGLKHVEVIHGDENFYPTPMSGHDYPWAGSLRPVSGKMAKGRSGRPDEDAGPSPWAGSLRHVDPERMRKKKQKKKEEDDMYGNAPWMGTLRHVKHENKVMAAMPKFKKYPDEDAPNPFESMQGRDAKPVYPLTAAAVMPAGGSSSEAKKNRQQMEEVERITAGLRETRTVSSALLKALMPKLLKEHESKYEPLGHDESFQIMEEILAMQVGLSADGNIDDNDEAEQMIRAITQGDINNKVYSQMADDLENAVQIKKKAEKSKKKKKKKPTTNTQTSASDLATSASESVVESAA